ncbi:MAG: hypothetical protein IJF07_01870, partial [Lachnospiraceae bacterium]|nr:hypothetical protein [Lachnospiraceae bacterium]
FKRNKGQIELVTGFFLVLFLAILLGAQLQLEAYRMASLYLEDALAASNLASAVIDLEEYGISHTIQIADPMDAYDRYCTALQANLHLDNEWMGQNKTLLSGGVTVVKYLIYNVKGDVVTIYCINESGYMTEWTASMGSVVAPDGTCIEATSIYSEIAFPIEGFLGLTAHAQKGKLVDIVANVD